MHNWEQRRIYHDVDWYNRKELAEIDEVEPGGYSAHYQLYDTIEHLIEQYDLTGVDREVFSMLCYRMRYREIAQVIGKSRQSVARIVARLRKRISRGRTNG